MRVEIEGVERTGGLRDRNRELILYLCKFNFIYILLTWQVGIVLGYIRFIGDDGYKLLISCGNLT